MIAEILTRDLDLTGEAIFDAIIPKEMTSGSTETSIDLIRRPKDRQCEVVIESVGVHNTLDITGESRLIRIPYEDLTQTYESPQKAILLADPRMIRAFIMYVRMKLDEKDATINELRYELTKLNKKRKFSSAGFRLPKDYYENDAYFVE
jgi:hypothetical protein